MEEKQYKDKYLPFAAAKLKNSSEIADDLLRRAGNYITPDDGRLALLAAIAKIWEAGGNIAASEFPLQNLGISSALSNWTGITDYLQESKLMDQLVFENVYHDEPKLIRSVVFTLPLDRSFSDGRKTVSSGYALGTSRDDPNEAVAKAIGELLERFPLLLYKEKDLLRASVSDLRKKRKFFLDIKDLAGFSAKQRMEIGRFAFSEESEFFWLEGKSLSDNKKYFLPAQLVFWNYDASHQNWNEPTLRESNTNGAGGHYTLAEAVLSGLYELVQRDGFVIYWLNEKGPPRIDQATIDYEPLVKLLEECRQLNFEVIFFDTTTDLGIPSCAVAVFDHSGVGPKISLGGGCEADWDQVLFKSLMEALSVYHWGRKRKESGKDYKLKFGDYKPFGDPGVGRMERLDLWAGETMFGRFQFFLKGGKVSLKELKLKQGCPKFSSPKEELNYLIKKFGDFGRGYEIFYYQAGHKALDDLGYVSVKVIVPALVPLYLREVLAPLGAARLKEVPEKLGFRAADRWNPLPHPFP